MVFRFLGIRNHQRVRCDLHVCYDLLQKIDNRHYKLDTQTTNDEWILKLDDLKNYQLYSRYQIVSSFTRRV